MEQELLVQAAENGIWVMLFVVLFLYTMYDSKNREKRFEDREDKYQSTIRNNLEIIQELSKKLVIVDEIHKDVSEIKNEINRR